MYYINIKTRQYGVETIDETPSWSEAVRLRKEYNIAGCGNAYISHRADRTWKEK